VDLGLSAKDSEVRYATYIAINLNSRTRWHPDRIIGPPDETYIRKLQAVMIAHLADDDWLSRICAAEILWDTTTPKDREGLPVLGPAGRKRRALIDASHEEMEQTQKAWAAWYEKKYR